MFDYYSPTPCRGDYYRQPTNGGQQQQQQIQPMFTQPTFPLPPIGTTVPTGQPLGPTTAPFPTVPGVPAQPPGEISPTTMQSINFTAGYLRTQIGRKVRVEFLIGTSSMTDRTGTLVGVGASYILIRLEESDDIMLCDLYSIKFVTFFY